MKRNYLLLLIAVWALQLQAQVTEFPFIEGFENEQFPPAGWLSYPVVGTTDFVRATVGEWPSCLPHDGSVAMAKYNSFSTQAGKEAVLISPELLLTEDNVLRFWFYRSTDPSNNRHDKIEVYYNSTADLDGATFLDSISRAINFYPIVPEKGWYQYEFAFNHPGSTYIIFKARSAYGWNMYLDNIEVNTNSEDMDPPVVISLEGTQVYAQQPMNLKLIVRDVSDLPETLDGEVTIDGETMEVLMTKTGGVQGDFTYRATLPGQPDHTRGEIRFWLIDEHTNSVWSGNYELRWDWIKPIFEEGFEGSAFPPEDWTVIGEPLTWFSWRSYGMAYYEDSDGVEYEVYPPEGQRQAAVEWDFQGNNQNEWLITPEIAITESTTLTFKTFARLRSYDYDDYLVKVSTNGFNWQTLWSAFDYPAGVSDYNEDIALSLDSYIGKDVRIAWHASNLYGGNFWYSWFVDDVKIRATDTLVGISQMPEFLVSRAFPNPFSAMTTIGFQTPGAGAVSLTVFRSDGAIKFQKTLSILSADLHEIKIDGNAWPSGIYFYRLHTQSGTSSGKIIRR